MILLQREAGLKAIFVSKYKHDFAQETTRYFQGGLVRIECIDVRLPPEMNGASVGKMHCRKMH